MLTFGEAALTVLAVFGVLYNGTYVVMRHERSKFYELFVLLYAVFIVVPHLTVILYAFTKMVVD